MWGLLSKCASRSLSALDGGLRLSSVQPPGHDLPLHRRQKWPRNPQENCRSCNLPGRGRRSSARCRELCVCRCEAGQWVTPPLHALSFQLNGPPAKVTSILHLQTAIYYALLAQGQGCLRTKTVHSEILWALNPSNNVRASIPAEQMQFVR